MTIEQLEDNFTQDIKTKSLALEAIKALKEQNTNLQKELKELRNVYSNNDN